MDVLMMKIFHIVQGISSTTVERTVFILQRKGLNKLKPRTCLNYENQHQFLRFRVVVQNSQVKNPCYFCILRMQYWESHQFCEVFYHQNLQANFKSKHLCQRLTAYGKSLLIELSALPILALTILQPLRNPDDQIQILHTTLQLILDNPDWKLRQYNIMACGGFC